MVVQSIRSVATPQHHVPTGNCPVREALHHNSLRGLARVTCELRAGMAILHGKVSSFYLKQLAQEVVKKVDGVELVVNQVDVGHVEIGG
jgi:osmotically-inducible protein OsmY